jgi:hypothetical protein
MAGKLKPKGYLRNEGPFVTKATKPKPTETPKVKIKPIGTRTVSRGR